MWNVKNQGFKNKIVDKTTGKKTLIDRRISQTWLKDLIFWWLNVNNRRILEDYPSLEKIS